MRMYSPERSQREQEPRVKRLHLETEAKLLANISEQFGLLTHEQGETIRFQVRQLASETNSDSLQKLKKVILDLYTPLLHSTKVSELHNVKDLFSDNANDVTGRIAILRGIMSQSIDAK